MIVQKKKLSEIFLIFTFAMVFLNSLVLPLIYFHRLNLFPDGKTVILFSVELIANKTNYAFDFLRKAIEKNSDGESEVYEDKPDKNKEESSASEKHAEDKSYDNNVNVIEKFYQGGGKKVGNFYVKNISGRYVDFERYLNKKLDMRCRDSKLPMVLIYHTHTTESYLTQNTKKTGDNSYFRTQDKNQNVIAVGKKIKEALEESGVVVVHSEDFHDYPNYNVAYQKSKSTVEEKLKSNPNIQFAIDIHRDSIGNNRTGKIKPICKIGGKNVSQIMLITGILCKKWAENLTLALKIQSLCEKMFPGLTRPLLFARTNYNQNVTARSILIEIGSDVNTLEESLSAGEKLGKAMAELIKSYRKR
ncbi:MAG: stage II sporulation protein P [Candidatus Improbicoccus pseudotrichonymphae]|uniref:Stage II sporulation protein P n=1 Tax=Candidatus Improbicoccus pseudotrichonymphae TaxID=3033792 RepID=A0AA48KVN7_9FIRM|nr:MAG: stage II sporulation protein P [Candidatus Improbicoccus pseudotrichonymphae]